MGQYVTGEMVFRCPSDRMKHPVKLYRSYSYAIGDCGVPGRYWVQGSRLPCRFFPDPSSVALVIERVTTYNQFGMGGYSSSTGTGSVQSQHGVSLPTETAPAANYLFMDGHVAWADTPQSNWFPKPPDAPWRPCP
jgi:prepilin-type processing-associated H-X9-DG protein